MADTEIEGILRELLGRTDLSADTREELVEFQTQAHAGRLDALDRAYVVGLAKRMGATGAGFVSARDPSAGDDGPDGYEEETTWRERAHEAEARAAAAEARLQAVKAAIERTVGRAATLDDGPQAQAMRELYDEVRLEIERAERGEV